MIISEIFYAVKCNRCEKICGEEVAFWNDEDSANENAMESEWIKERNKHFCPNCYDYDEESDEQKAKPNFPEHVKNLKKFCEKMIIGGDFNINEKQDSFIFSKSLYNKKKIELFEENYIKEMLGDKLISLECKKHDRFTSYYCYIIVSK